ncbi:MAG: energy transducer TonB, partial [Bacteroidetes bacterium]|nr:energy transducer TonB [Bacteroidota bacterium]
MKYFAALMFLVLIGGKGYAQEKPKPTIEEKPNVINCFENPKRVVKFDSNYQAHPFELVEQMPEFLGGDDSMLKFINRNLVYPKLAKDLEVEGKVLVEFVVKRDGNIEDISIRRDIGGGCGKAAIEVIK